MIDMRAMINDRTYLTTFVVGNRYATVLSNNRTFPEILVELENYLGELKKPFVILSSAYMYDEEARELVDRDLIDLVLE